MAISLGLDARMIWSLFFYTILLFCWLSIFLC